MSKAVENEKLTISIKPKINTAIRMLSARTRMTISELVEKFYEAWLREQEREKTEKKGKEVKKEEEK